MKQFLLQTQWNWKTSGFMLGLVFLLAVVLVKPIGVSTQFVIFNGIVWSSVSDDLIKEKTDAKSGYESSNAYLNKSGGKYARNIKDPFNYSFIFVLAMIAGGFIASRLQSKNDESENLVSPPVFRKRFGDSRIKRYAVVFIGGILVLFGARLAGGCTSGHMMSGMMQTSISGYLFALGAFAAAVPVALIMYRERK